MLLRLVCLGAVVGGGALVRKLILIRQGNARNASKDNNTEDNRSTSTSAVRYGAGTPSYGSTSSRTYTPSSSVPTSTTSYQIHGSGTLNLPTNGGNHNVRASGNGITNVRTDGNSVHVTSTGGNVNLSTRSTSGNANISSSIYSSGSSNVVSRVSVGGMSAQDKARLKSDMAKMKSDMNKAFGGNFMQGFMDGFMEDD